MYILTTLRCRITRLLRPTRLLNFKISSHLHCYLESTLIRHHRVLTSALNSRNLNSVVCQKMDGIVKFGPSIISQFCFKNHQIFDADTKFVLQIQALFSSIHNQRITFDKLNYISLHYNKKINFWAKYLDSGDSEWQLT